MPSGCGWIDCEVQAVRRLLRQLARAATRFSLLVLAYNQTVGWRRCGNSKLCNDDAKRHQPTALMQRESAQLRCQSTRQKYQVPAALEAF
jgi:hypothetical protein